MLDVKDNIIYLQCKNNFLCFSKGEIYQIVDKYNEFWTILLNNDLVKISVKDVRDNFIPVR